MASMTLLLWAPFPPAPKSKPKAGGAKQQESWQPSKKILAEEEEVLGFYSSISRQCLEIAVTQYIYTTGTETIKGCSKKLPEERSLTVGICCGAGAGITSILTNPI
jgi:hypothetical protein